MTPRILVYTCTIELERTLGHRRYLKQLHADITRSGGETALAGVGVRHVGMIIALNQWTNALVTVTFAIQAGKRYDDD